MSQDDKSCEFGKEDNPKEANNTDSNIQTFEPFDMSCVPYDLKRICRWIEGEPYPVIKCRNRRLFLLIFGLLLLAFIILYILEHYCCISHVVWHSWLLFGIGIIFTTIGGFQFFSSTWIMIKDNYIEVAHGIFRCGNTIILDPKTTIVQSEITGQTEGADIFRIYFYDNSSIQKVNLIEGLFYDKKSVAESYFEKLLMQLSKNQKSCEILR